MGREHFPKTRRTRFTERKAGIREPKPDSFLIITEGEKTEPAYFSGLADYINKKYDGRSIDVHKPVIDSQGEGKSTVNLVWEAKKIEARSRILYSQTWVLFDKDDFEDFDEAVEKCKELGLRSGWSNPSFEYWLYLHFEYSEAALHRDEWCDKLDKVFKARKINKSGYDKTDRDLFIHAAANGGLRNAIRNAERIDRNYHDSRLPSKCDPCTKVYFLLRELEQWIQELL